MTQEFVTLPRSVVEQAVEALFCTDSEEGSTAYKNELEAVKKLRAALEQPQGDQEPVAWCFRKSLVQKLQWQRPVGGNDVIQHWAPLYTHPQPPRQPLTIEQPQANQPAMTPIAQRKLEDLVASGYTISGYSIYHEKKQQHGFVTGAGLVGWWKPEGMEYPQPQGEPSTVAFCHVGDVVVCDNDSLLRQLGVKRSDKLYLHPQDLNCKSKQALLATLWGYTKEQPKRPPLTDNQIDKIAESMPGGLEGFLNVWGWRQFARAVLENDHNIK